MKDGDCVIIWKFTGIVLLTTSLAGCGLSSSERAAIIDAAAEQSSAVASAAAQRQVFESMLAQGKSVDEAKAIAAKAAEVAGIAAGAVASAAAGKAADAVADEKRSKTSGWLAAALPGVLALLGGLAKKAVAA
jgi:hypothetical protein